jgi:hypothetical protein
MAAGLDALRNEHVRTGGNCDAGLFGAAHGAGDRDPGRAMAGERGAPVWAFYDVVGGRLGKAHLDVRLSGERGEQVRGHRPTRRQLMGGTQRGGEGASGLDTDSAKTTGRRHRTGQLAAGRTAAHPGLHDRNRQAEVIE